LRKACLIATLPLPVLSLADEGTSRLEWPTQADYQVTLRLLRPTDFGASEAVFSPPRVRDDRCSRSGLLLAETRGT
jgi:hypothetical protein